MIAGTQPAIYAISPGRWLKIEAVCLPVQDARSTTWIGLLFRICALTKAIPFSDIAASYRPSISKSNGSRHGLHHIRMPDEVMGSNAQCAKHEGNA